MRKAETKYNKDGSIQRIIEFSNGDFAVDLFPYKIKNRELFYDRNHPENIAPESFEYEEYWKQRLQNYLEGRWVNDEGTWVFMPPKLDFYINYVPIVDEERKTIKPRLRDNEWIMSYYGLCAEGFSGFELDEEYTCNELVEKWEAYEKDNKKELKAYELSQLESSNYTRKKDGSYKKYINAWVYLTEHYLLTHKKDFSLGKAVYENNKYDEMTLAARTIGKSFYGFAGNLLHEWLTNGAKSVEEFKKFGSNQKLFGAGAVKANQLDRSLGIIKRMYNDMPGSYVYGIDDKGKEDKVNGFLYKRIIGSWESGGKVEHKVENINNTIDISGSILQAPVLTPDNFKIFAGDRFAMIFIEEVGFVPFLKKLRNAFRDSLGVGKKKVGKACYLGCVCAGTKIYTKSGEVKNIEDLTIEDGIIGYDGRRSAEQVINFLKPPAKKECYRITTDSNTVIECSDDHPLLITRRHFTKKVSGKLLKRSLYQEAKHIKVKDQLLMPSKVDVFGANKIDNARLYGLLIGDGNYSINSSPTLSVSERDIMDYAEPKSIGFSKMYTQKNGEDYKQLTFGRGIKNELIENGMYGQVKENKRLPKNIHTYSKESLAELLAGYFDADGNIYYNSKKDIVRVVLTSICKELLEEVKYQLLKFGIHCSIIKENRNTKPSEEYKGHKNHIFRLYINQQQDLVTFRDNIKLLNKSKVEKLSKIKDSKYKVFDTIFELNPLNNKEGYFNRLDNSDILKNLRYETVTKVEFIGEKEVYNLNCNDNHNYISNKFITRQTGGDMEAIQDAKEMFENPEAFSIYGIPNYFDKNRQGTIGLFLSACLKAEEFKDSNGNTIYEDALLDVIEQREGEYEKSDSTTFWEFIAFNPLYPKEMLRPSSKSVLPIVEMSEHRGTLIITDKWKNRASIGSFKWDMNESSKVGFRRDFDNSLYIINDWGKDKELHNREGGWVMYEDVMPQRPDNLYYILYDPAAHSGEGTSLHSGLVYKHKFTGGNQSMQETFVAEFIGRKPTLEQNFEEIIRAALYYNAQILPEVNTPGFVEWAERKGWGHFIMYEPQRFLSEVRRTPQKFTHRKGIRVDDIINKWSLTRFGDWLRQPIMVDEDGVPLKFRFQNIFSLRLLDEGINFTLDNKTEYDHMSSALLLMPLLLEIEEDYVEILDEFADPLQNKYSKYSALDYKPKGRSRFINY